jgi:hypothetical protein
MDNFNISLLPCDVIRHIISFHPFTLRTIARTRRVCKQWELALSRHALELSRGLDTVDDQGLSYIGEDIITSVLGLRTKIFRSYQCTGEMLANVASKCPELTDLMLLVMHYINDISLLIPVTQMSNLTALYVESSQCITDEFIMEVARNCNLTKLHVYGCNITDVSMLEVARNCPNLMEVGLGGGKITDASIVAVASACPKLTKITGYSKFTDTAIVAVASNCPNLTALIIPYCSAVTDTSIVEVARACPKLTCLDLKQCNLLTNVSIVALRKYCCLTRLDVRWCPNITSSIIKQLYGTRYQKEFRVWQFL